MGGCIEIVLGHFIRNFTDGGLNRHLRSAAASPPQQCSVGDICVVEVTSSSFNSIVMDSSKVREI